MVSTSSYSKQFPKSDPGCPSSSLTNELPNRVSISVSHAFHSFQIAQKVFGRFSLKKIGGVFEMGVGGFKEGVLLSLSGVVFLPLALFKLLNGSAFTCLLEWEIYCMTTSLLEELFTGTVQKRRKGFVLKLFETKKLSFGDADDLYSF